MFSSTQVKSTGNIIIVDDDMDDLILFKEALELISIPNKILVFNSPHDALVYLQTTTEEIFFILSDINMPGLNGYEFREQIVSHNDLFIKSVPFLFVSTAANFEAIKKAHENSIQGFFKKPTSMSGLELMFKAIILYWTVNIPLARN